MSDADALLADPNLAPMCRHVAAGAMPAQALVDRLLEAGADLAAVLRLYAGTLRNTGYLDGLPQCALAEWCLVTEPGKQVKTYADRRRLHGPGRPAWQPVFRSVPRWEAVCDLVVDEGAVAEELNAEMGLNYYSAEAVRHLYTGPAAPRRRAPPGVLAAVERGRRALKRRVLGLFPEVRYRQESYVPVERPTAERVEALFRMGLPEAEGARSAAWLMACAADTRARERPLGVPGVGSFRYICEPPGRDVRLRRDFTAAELVPPEPAPRRDAAWAVAASTPGDDFRRAYGERADGVVGVGDALVRGPDGWRRARPGEPTEAVTLRVLEGGRVEVLPAAHV